MEVTDDGMCDNVDTGLFFFASSLLRQACMSFLTVFISQSVPLFSFKVVLDGLSRLLLLFATLVWFNIVFFVSDPWISEGLSELILGTLSPVPLDVVFKEMSRFVVLYAILEGLRIVFVVSVSGVLEECIFV